MSTENLMLGMTHVLTGALIIAVCLPLLKNQIKPNALYGIRLAKSFESEENWYKMNRYGAAQLIRWSIVMIVFGVITLFLPLRGKDALVTIVALAPALLLLVPALQIYRYSKTL